MAQSTAQVAGAGALHESPQPYHVDPATLSQRIRTATRFVFTPMAKAAKATVQMPRGRRGEAATTAAHAHLSMQVLATDQPACVVLRQPMHVLVAPLGAALSATAEPRAATAAPRGGINGGDATSQPAGACEPLRLHAVLGLRDDEAEAVHAEPRASAATPPPPTPPEWSWSHRLPAPRLSLRMLHWNILDGCAFAPQRLGGIGRWLQLHGVDVATFNELNGWSDSTFARLARSWGFGYSTLLETGTGYHLGLASRHPIVVEAASNQPPFHHGYLLVQVGGLRICVVHLSPSSAAHRLIEARELLRLERRTAARRPFLLFGDLNTLSPLDAAEHEASALVSALAAEESLTRKFLTRNRPAGTAATLAGADATATQDVAAVELRVAAPPPDLAIDYAPMRELLEGGLVDAGHATSVSAAAGAAVAEDPVARGAEGADLSSSLARVPHQNHSVPTQINTDAMHAAAMRLDYALINDVLAQQCAVRSWLVRDADTERLSDHYPLLTDLECEDR